MTPTAETCPTCRSPLPAGQTTCPTCSRGATSGAGEATVLLGTTQAALGEIEKGMRVGGYTILREVARGAMGIVYQAKDSKLDRVVALKVLIAGELASPDQVARFQREAQAAAKLRHANIVPIYDIGVAGGKHFFTMEFVEGKSLHAFLSARENSVDDAVRLLAQVADGMEHAHKHGVIHRDLKPANILVDAEGNVRVTDFGLSKAVHGSQLTESGTTLGSPSYMPPEQARGLIAEVDARSDVYAMGAILYEALTGAPPFVGDTQVDTILKVIKDEPLPPRRRNAKVPSELEAICLKALEKEKSRRYASAKEFGDDLRRYLAHEPVLARPASFIYRWKKKLARHRLAVGITAAVVLANVVLIGWLSHRTNGGTAPPPPVEEGRWEKRVDEPFRDAALPAWEVEGSWKVEDGALVGDGKATLRLREGIPGSWAVEVKVDPAQSKGYHWSLGDERPGLVNIISSPPDLVSAHPPADGDFLRIERRPLAVDTLGGSSATVHRVPLDGSSPEVLHPELTLLAGHLRIVALRVFGESAAFRGSPLPVAEKLFARRMYGLAKESYSDCLESHKTGPLAEEARYGVAECALRAAEASVDAEEAQEAKDLLAQVKDPRWASLAQKETEECDRVLHAGAEAGGIGTFPGLTPSDPFNRVLALLFVKGSEEMTPVREAELSKAYDAVLSSKAADKAAFDACMAWAGNRVVRREWKEAESVYAEAVSRAPQESLVVVWFLVEFCRFQQGNFAGVEEAEKKVSESTPKRVLDRLHQLRHPRTDPRTQEEMKKLRELMQRAKDPAQSLDDEPLVQEAKAVFELAALGPFLQYGKLLTAKAKAYQGKAKEALAALQNGLAKENLDPAYEGRMRLLKGQIERASGDAKAAMRTFEEIKGADWLQFEAAMQLLETSILTDEGKGAIASEDADRGRFKGPPERGRMALWFGLAHLVAGDEARARTEWREGLSVLGVDPSDHAAMRLALGEKLPDDEKAKAQLSSAETKLWRGVALRLAGNKEDAKKLFEGASHDAVGQEFPFEVAKSLAGRP